jgi:predicted Zn-dependent peptidase
VIDQVNNITPADIAEWFNNHYVARNMVLTIVGNFDINTIHKQVETSCAQYVRTGVKTPTVHNDVVFDKDINVECVSEEATRLMLGWNIGKSDLNYKLLAADEIVERILFNGEDSELKNLLSDSDFIDVGGHICRTSDDGWITIGGGVHGNACVDKLYVNMDKFAKSLASFDVYSKSFNDHVRKAKQALLEQTRDKLSDIDEVIEYLPKLYTMGITNMSSMNDMWDVTPSDVAEVIQLMQQPHVMSKVVAV